MLAQTARQCEAQSVREARRRHRLDATPGRGLMPVDELASNWGVEPADAGKRVWFEINSPVFRGQFSSI